MLIREVLSVFGSQAVLHRLCLTVVIYHELGFRRFVNEEKCGNVELLSQDVEDNRNLTRWLPRDQRRYCPRVSWSILAVG